MKVEFINPFVNAAINVLTTMASTEPKASKPELKTDNLSRGVVTGLVGMAGEKLSGNMILSFEEATILGIVSSMLMEEFTEINDEVADAVGELTNMISGGAKKELNESGYSFEMATPIMLKGEGVELKQLSATPVISIPFTTDKGAFWIEANLAPNK